MSTITLPRPAERIAIFSFVVVFLCGAVAGALVMSMAKNSGLHGSAPPSASLSHMSVAELKTGLNLSDDQTRQLTSILDDFSHYYDNLLADGYSRIRQILNPDQQILFEKMLSQHRK